MQPHAVEYVAVIKILFAGFVVHHPVIAAGAGVPGVHPVDKAPQDRVHAAVWNWDGRQTLPVAEANLKARRGKRRLAQLLPQLPSHHVQLLNMAAEQVRHPFRLDLAEMLPGVFLAEAMGDFQCFL